jgi:hypothetical protein
VTTTGRYCRACPRSWLQWLLPTMRPYYLSAFSGTELPVACRAASGLPFLRCGRALLSAGERSSACGPYRLQVAQQPTAPCRLLPGAHVTRVLAIMHPETLSHQVMWQSIEEAAPRLAIEAITGHVHNAAEIERVITSFAQKPDGGLIVLPHALTVFNASLIIALAHRYRMPDVHALAEAVAVGEGEVAVPVVAVAPTERSSAAREAVTDR